MEGVLENVLPEELLSNVVNLLVRLVESAGALVIFVGAAIAFVRFLLTAARSRRAEAFVPVRLDLGRFLALGLEFQLASDVLSTAVAPTFQEIGRLAAVAAIRTALNYFLGREIKEEREEVAAEREYAAGGAAGDAERRTGDHGGRDPRGTDDPVGDRGGATVATGTTDTRGGGHLR